MKNYIILCFLFFFLVDVKAQDPIFTQYFMVPETLNPGFTGFLETTTAGILHRTQWPDLNFRVDSDFGFVNTWSDKINSGYGITLLSQRERFTNYSLSQANFSYAYRVQLNDDWYFRPAVTIGFGTKSFGFQNLILEDQINIGSGTINPTSIDPTRVNEKVSFFDFSAGMLFNNETTWFGAAIKHLNKPNISFTQTGNLPLEMFFSANVGHEMLVEDYFDLGFIPLDTKFLFTANYMKQGQFNRLDLGTGIIFKNLFFGVSVATNPIRNTNNGHYLTSINPFGGLQYEHFKFGYSYDINVSGIGQTGGVYELSVLYQFDFKVRCLGCPLYY